jgi:deoxyuridine 5'-triphosphate nucleotidohydrolase
MEMDFNENLQSDDGANINATNNKKLLTQFKEITPKNVNSINNNENTDTKRAQLTGYGYMHLKSKDGNKLKIKVYYGEQLSGTVISPTAMTKEHINTYSGFLLYANVDDKNGELKLTHRNGSTLDFPLHSINDLWYHGTKTNEQQTNATINHLSDAAAYELWHQRCGHRGHNTMTTLHKHATGVPRLKGNSLWKCPSCQSGKISKIKHQKEKQKQTTPKTSNKQETETNDDIFKPDAKPGQHFHMDFGFVRGSGFMEKDEDGRTLTSIDGYNSYLIIIDRATRYTWTFLTKSKEPPIEQARAILKKFKTQHPHKTVRTDQGKELGKSEKFKTMIQEENFNLELTGSDASHQNGMAERPNRTFGDMMRCMLHSAGLGPEYWSYALIHATYILNRMPHSSINMSPYQALTGNKPDLRFLRIFGSHVNAKKPGSRPYKLDHHSFDGIYLGNTATPKNVYIKDSKTNHVKIGTHVTYDEAHMSVPASKAPLAAQALQRLGYHKDESWKTELNTKPEDKNIQMKLLSPNAIQPTRMEPDSTRYEVFNPQTTIELKPNETIVIPTDIAIQPPKGCQARIISKQELLENKITTHAGNIDPKYKGNICAILHNFGDEIKTIQKGEPIAQLIFEKLENPDINIVKTFKQTKETTYGNIKIKHTETAPITAAVAKLDCNMQLELSMPYDINLSSNPFDNHTTRIVSTKGKHPTLGFTLKMCPIRGLPKITHITQGTPAARISKWNSQIRNGYLTGADNKPIKTINDFRKHITDIRKNKKENTTIQVATISKQAMHPQQGTPQMYHDQLNIIAQHLWEIKHTPISTDNEKQINIKTIMMKDKTTKTILKQDIKHVRKNIKKILKNKPPKKLTRRYLEKQIDWTDWKESERKQLQQYEDQETFGKPTPYKKGTNLLNLIWTYNIKDDGRKKARCVCNGSPKQKGTITLGETYAASLDQSGSRVFWAAAALKNMIVIGADASNAFAEAPPPKAPLYVTIDKPFREWWASKGRDPIPPGHVLPVYKALQGHPESPRLWAKLIDKIIQELDLKPCKHEPCLYYTNNYKNTGKKVLFLRQVDDFSVACEDKTLAKDIIKEINNKMTIDVKELGLIDRFNGVDIKQTREYIKLSNQTYVNKIIDHHPWLQEDHNTHRLPIPMRADPGYLRKIESAEPLTEPEVKLLEKEYGFKYRQGIGELIYAMVTCRPDISFPIIKLAQYSTKPAKIHFDAVKNLYIYLKATKHEGIYFWRQKHRHDLPTGEIPTCNNTPLEIPLCEQKQQHKADILHGAVDSDHAGDTTHRKSVTGTIHRIAGGTVLYKTRYQDVIATSSTEAEFLAAVEAGKQSLYLRTILEEIGIEQHQATVLYEDNQGALLMANAQQPTKRSRHMDIRSFALQDWVEKDLIVLHRIPTSDNYADAMTKALPRTLFYRHMNYIQGKYIPEYAKITQKLYKIRRLYFEPTDISTNVSRSKAGEGVRYRNLRYSYEGRTTPNPTRKGGYISRPAKSLAGDDYLRYSSPNG